MSHDWQDATCTEPKTCIKCGKTEGEALGHTWADATCTESKTCSICGATEGEALGHIWIDATCTVPKACSNCGATEGEALGHTLTEANYQQAAICTVCGATVGEPLEADFEKYGLTQYLVELDKEYDCIIMCNDNHAYTTNAKLSFSNYQTFSYGIPKESGYFTISSELPEEPGYEYRTVDVTISFNDKNAKQYGASIKTCWENYYDIVGFDDSSQARDDGWIQFTVNWNGTDYTECIDNYINEWESNDDSTYTYHAIYITRVPIGYDGYVLGFRNGQIEWGDGQHIFDLDNTDTLFFRFE